MKIDDLKNILFLDIETVPIEQCYDQLAEPMKKLWDHKASKSYGWEELPVEELYDSKAGIFAEFGKIVCIVVGICDLTDPKHLILRVKSFFSHNEKEILTAFKELLETKFDQQKLRLCAHNGKEFDFPFICRRMLINAIELPATLSISGKKPWEVLHLDTMEMWKFGDRKNFTSLNLLANIFKIPSSKYDIDGSQVRDVYYNEEGLERITTYCAEDVIVTARVFLKLMNIHVKLEPQIIDL
ncbi:3'-5' exonuclease [Fulvivirgaceae bacterium BMA10]|uniref:3'-5' exonuclease n=1 Tax=Splendidivirga corallicola TaxID=3051826 RepID=A0ABT8KTN2_9BACT|nr:3'-5' exonuclease [Fulvivirgaceae bacterium BMA10]